MSRALRSVSLLFVLLLGCGEDPQPGMAVGFQTSTCKTRTSGQSLLAVAQQVTPHDGLRCVTWEQQGETVRFGLTNFEGGCSVQYAGQAFVAERSGIVTLSLTNPGGAAAACGWCVYDFVFDVKQVPAGDLLVELQRSDTPERSKDPGIRFQLPAGAAARGVVCDYGYSVAMSTLAVATGKVGQRNWACNGSACQAGTSCKTVDDSGNHRLCLADCSDDSNCGDSMFACRDGACQIRTPPR